MIPNSELISRLVLVWAGSTDDCTTKVCDCWGLSVTVVKKIGKYRFFLGGELG